MAPLAPLATPMGVRTADLHNHFRVSL